MVAVNIGDSLSFDSTSLVISVPIRGSHRYHFLGDKTCNPCWPILSHIRKSENQMVKVRTWRGGLEDVLLRSSTLGSIIPPLLIQYGAIVSVMFIRMFFRYFQIYKSVSIEKFGKNVTRRTEVEGWRIWVEDVERSLQLRWWLGIHNPFLSTFYSISIKLTLVTPSFFYTHLQYGSSFLTTFKNTIIETQLHATNRLF